jgi:hypothetical protein
MPARRNGPPPTFLGPTDFDVLCGLPVPDPITFVVSPLWLNRSNLYPRQATLLKVVFLREDLFTEYDYDVVQEWEVSFRQSGENGITPNILERMRYLKAEGYSHFREVLLIMGRRGSKGYVSALCMVYVLWQYMAKGDPQGFYGVDRDKQLACYVYAGKKEQARENLWKDLVNVIMGAPCFEKYISRPMGESLSVYAPHDFVRKMKQEQRGVRTAMDTATFTIQPKESTLMSGRGPTSYCQAYDEMAHLVSATGASRSAEEVYEAATPALDQFKQDAFIIEPSSPWQMTGQFYQNWVNSLLIEDGKPVYPEMMMLQLTSWEIYLDWQEAHLLPLFPEDFQGDLKEYVDAPLPMLPKLKLAIQEYDEAMQRLERSNPETFSVERRSRWQAVVDAYLNKAKVAEMFAPWNGKTLTMQTTGLLTNFYKGHADPSLVNANFGIAIAHPEKDDQGITHCVFDYIHHYEPSNWEDGIVDYIEVGDDIWRLIEGFKPDEFTYDQWNSAEAIQRINKKIREANFPKRVMVYEKTASVKHNWERAECFKVGLNLGWIHAPLYEQAELELRYLQLKNGKVEKQDTGPIQTKDVADCLMETVWTILGEQVHQWTHGALSQLSPSGSVSGGFDPHTREYEAPVLGQELSNLGRRNVGKTSTIRGGGLNPARNPLAGTTRRGLSRRR